MLKNVVEMDTKLTKHAPKLKRNKQSANKCCNQGMTEDDIGTVCIERSDAGSNVRLEL